MHEANAAKQSQVGLLIDLIPDQLLVRQPLVRDARREEFVEVEAVFHQELDVARLELQDGVAENLTVLEDVEVERPKRVAVGLLVPLGSADAELERVHSRAVVLQLLVAVFHDVEAVHLIFVADVEP